MVMLFNKLYDPILALILIRILISVSHPRWGLDFYDPSLEGSIRQGSMSHGAEVDVTTHKSYFLNLQDWSAFASAG